VYHRVRRWFSGGNLLDADDARDMFAWDNGDFLHDASVRIGGRDRAGLKRLLPIKEWPRSGRSESSVREESSVARFDAF
jgi:hypothetical protein